MYSISLMFSFGIQRRGRCLIGDEMGLGKTLQAIALASYYREDWPLLIITPSSIRLQWAEQLQRWLRLPEADVNVILTGKSPCDSLVNIMSYELVPKMLDKVTAQQFKIVIADESHYLKTWNAKRTMAIKPIIKVVILLRPNPLGCSSSCSSHRHSCFVSSC